MRSPSPQPRRHSQQHHSSTLWLVAFVPMLMLRPSHDRLAVFRRAGRLFAWILTGVSILVAAVSLRNSWTCLGPGLAPAQKHTAVILLEISRPGFCLPAAPESTPRSSTPNGVSWRPATYQLCLNGATIVFALACWRGHRRIRFPPSATPWEPPSAGRNVVRSRDLRISRARAHFAPLRRKFSRSQACISSTAGLMSANIRADPRLRTPCRTRRPPPRSIYSIALRQRGDCVSRVSGGEFPDAGNRQAPREQRRATRLPPE